MRNLLLVDDERNILLGLKAMTEREFPGQYQIHLAGDGVEAMELMEKVPMDIAVCDIRMPRMDGLELIGQMSILDRKPFIMILSGHEDFRYAREAIRYNVKEYLLKPIVREDYYRTLRRLEAELQRNENQERMLTRSAEDVQKLAESRIANVLLHPSSDRGEIRRMLEQAHIDWMDGSFRVGIIKVPESEDKAQELHLERMEQELRAAVANLNENYIYVWDKAHRLVIAGTSCIFQRIMELMRSENHRFAVMSLGLSKEHKGMEWIKKAYNEADLALKHNFLQRRSDTVEYEKIELSRTHYELPESDIEKLYNMLGTDRDQEMKTILYGMFNEDIIAAAGYDYIETVSTMLNERIFDRVFRLYGKESVEILRLFKQVSSISNFNHVHEYLIRVEELLSRLHQYVKSIKTVRMDNRAMKEAISYIHEHYDKDINMTVVSNSISLNYYYFSQSFKEYTGDNFVDYLRNFRIQKAKEMLAATNLKVYEIASRAGFTNIKHFNRVFRKLEGISPLEYREQQQMNPQREE